MTNIKVKAILASTFLVTALLALSVNYHGGIVSAKGRVCDNRMLRGTYGNSFRFLNQVFPYPNPLPIQSNTHIPGAGISVYTFDGYGNFHGPLVWSHGGKILRGTISGTYTVNANCMGSMEWLSENLEFVIVNDGNEIYTLGTEDSHIAVGTMRKQFPTDN
jgi:hypothetical protein